MFGVSVAAAAAAAAAAVVAAAAAAAAAADAWRVRARASSIPRWRWLPPSIGSGEAAKRRSGEVEEWSRVAKQRRSPPSLNVFDFCCLAVPGFSFRGSEISVYRYIGISRKRARKRAPVQHTDGSDTIAAEAACDARGFACW